MPKTDTSVQTPQIAVEDFDAVNIGIPRYTSQTTNSQPGTVGPLTVAILPITIIIVKSTKACSSSKHLM